MPRVKDDGARSSVPEEVIVPVAVAVICIAGILIAVPVIAVVCVLRRRQTSESTNIHTTLLPLRLHFLPQIRKRRNKTGFYLLFMGCYNKA